MPEDDEPDRDDVEFIEVEGHLPPLSRSAFGLHSAAIVESVRMGFEGWIDDDWLTAIKADTTVTVLELETAGLWTREDDGYRINDEQTIAMSQAFQDRMELGARECEEAGEHVIKGKGKNAICTRCLAPIGRQQHLGD